MEKDAVCICFVKHGKWNRYHFGYYFRDIGYWDCIPEVFSTTDEEHEVITSIMKTIAEGKNYGVCEKWTWYVRAV